MAETPYTVYSYPKGSFMAVIHASAQDALDRAEPLTVAAAYAPCRDAALAELMSAVADLADLVESGRCPGDLLAERVGEIGPLAALGAMAHA